jgi:antitoxin component of RelBE/YafQ-DinJ toxin-antitoxin module
MGLPKTVRFDDDLEKQVENYLEANGIKFSQLVNLAVANFISKPQTIQLAPVNTQDFVATAKKAFSKHKNAMDKLK